MTTKMKILIGIMLGFLLLISFVNTNKPKPVDWSETYHLRDKLPFGLYIFDQEKHHFFKPKSENIIKVIEDSPEHYFYHVDDEEYEDDEIYSDENEVSEVNEISPEKIEEIKIIDTVDTIDYKVQQDSTATTVSDFYNHENILYIRDKKAFEDASIQVILEYVNLGKTAFLSATDFNKTLLEALKIDMIYEFTPETDFVFGFYDKKLKSSTCKYNKGTYGHYFSKIDSTTTQALGFQMKNNQKKTNFIVVNYGKGKIYLHSQPVVFTNYYMLDNNNYPYLSNLFKTIPPNDWLWFVKDQEIESYASISENPLRFIGQHPPLKWAYWLFWIALILFLLFNSKRKQRIIPIIKPLENTTIDFTKTIANLYFQEKNYKIIIRKKIIYFLEKVRTTYYLDTSKLDDEFALKLAHKSGKNEEDLKQLIKLIVELKNRGFFYEEDLTKLNQALEQHNF